MNSIFTNRFGFPSYRLIEFDHYTVDSNNAKLEANNITFWVWTLFCFLFVFVKFPLWVCRYSPVSLVLSCWCTVDSEISRELVEQTIAQKSPP